uniref:Uncharacterized protein n=1 Tax=Haemonchus contortus TaxID=6289 RepID=W6NBG5_HAECO
MICHRTVLLCLFCSVLINVKLTEEHRKTGSKKANYSGRRGRSINHWNKNFSIEDFLLMKNDSEALWDFANGSAVLRAKRLRSDENEYEYNEGNKDEEGQEHDASEEEGDEEEEGQEHDASEEEGDEDEEGQEHDASEEEGMEDDIDTSEADTEASSTTEMNEEKTETSEETREMFDETTETSGEATERSGETMDAGKKDDEQEEASGSGFHDNSSTTEGPLIVSGDEGESNGQEANESHVVVAPPIPVPVKREESYKEVEYKDEDDGFPIWIFIVLIPLVLLLLISIACFAITKKSLDSALKKRDQMLKSQARKEAGQACSAVDGSLMGTDYAGFGTEVRKPVREGGMGSIMRDPDDDPSVRPEKAQISRMVYVNNQWKTVDKVPSDMSFEIPSESM